MDNQTLCQFFHWYLPQDGAFWQHFEQEAPQLAAKGITHAWLPPAYKGSGGAASVGYDVYDLYDLGEFDQKGSVATKYGDRTAYLKAVAAAQQQGLKVIADIVLNHRLGGDEKERFRVKRINPDNRNETIGEPFEIDAYTRFTFPGRAGKYSNYIWDFHSFSGLDHADNLKPEEQGIFKVLNEYGEDWSQAVADEKGNFDYLLGADVEFRNPHVREELNDWGRWYLDTTGVSGLRLDALKHMSWKFAKA
jgi:alpha-amylase